MLKWNNIQATISRIIVAVFDKKMILIRPILLPDSSCNHRCNDSYHFISSERPPGWLQEFSGTQESYQICNARYYSASFRQHKICRTLICLRFTINRLMEFGIIVLKQKCYLGVNLIPLRLRSIDKPLPLGNSNGLGAGGNPQLRKGIVQVPLHRIYGNMKFQGNFIVGISFAY